MSGRDKPCSRGCCWTPQDVCAKAGNCPCHRSRQALEDMRLASQLGISLDEQWRREALRRKAVKPGRRKVKDENGKWKAA